VNGKSLTDKEDVAEVIDLTEIDLDEIREVRNTGSFTEIEDLKLIQD